MSPVHPLYQFLQTDNITLTANMRQYEITKGFHTIPLTNDFIGIKVAHCTSLQQRVNLIRNRKIRQMK